MSSELIAFHKKMGFPIDEVLKSTDHPFLRQTASMLADEATRCETDFRANGDQRFLRAHLMIEELGEVIQAMNDGNELLLLDALADLLYVVEGTGVTYNLPLMDAFQEVHRSNMTKSGRSDDNPRLRDKGSDYDPPKLAEILKRHRLGSKPEGLEMGEGTSMVIG